MQILDEIRQFIVDTFLFGQDGDLRNDDSFLERGLLDSTGVLELITYLEERFGVKVQDHDLTPENLDSLQRVAAYVERQLAAAESLNAAPA